MSNVIAVAHPKSVTFEGIITRCGCSEEEKVSSGYHANYNILCPNPREVKDLGIIAYRNSNPLLTMWWHLKKFFV